MKKLAALLLTLVLSLNLFGCAKGQQTEIAASAVSSSSDKTTSTDSELPQCTLNYVSWMTKGEDQATLDAFMIENPQITVENRSLAGSSYDADLNTLMLGGDTPDVFMVQPYQIPSLIAGGYIRPLTGVAGVEKQASNESVNAFLSKDGDVYGYALNGGYGKDYVYYNKAFFEENHLTEPTTIEEFEALCAKIKELGMDPLIVPAGDTWNAIYPGNNYFLKALRDCGNMSKHEHELALLTGEKKPSDFFGDAFRAMKKYYDNGWISEGGVSMGWETGTQFFVDGNAAMIITGNWLPGSAPIVNTPDFELGCFYMPGIPNEDGKSCVYQVLERILVMSSSSENPDAAQALFEYMIRDDVLSEYLISQNLQGINIQVPVDPIFEQAIEQLTGDDYALEIECELPCMPSGWAPNQYQYAADIYSGADVEELLQKLDADYEAAMSTVNVQSYIDKLS